MNGICKWTILYTLSHIHICIRGIVHRLWHKIPGKRLRTFWAMCWKSDLNVVNGIPQTMDILPEASCVYERGLIYLMVDPAIYSRILNDLIYV
ncbi:hypothetical protein GDO78_002147 [Eleutherodactylus coqui]|uniref:Uncharacterized protein n=1 Tax=Eleutherodactylus coqui TaxID=57060 RepID=A0A8J6FTU0_ELECQ|nr:hypothetical protein GDO78_002147 [Eleutherodactylus coqui]